MRLWLAVVVATNIGACAREARSSRLSDISLLTSEGRPSSLNDYVSNSRYTIVEFFSADCPVQRAHDRRLIELFERYRSYGVAIVLVDSESGASPERDAVERRARGYPFPLLIDERGRLAEAVGAAYSTYSLILDREGHVHYRGGVDSDRLGTASNSVPYLRNALDELLSGSEPRIADSKAFGCALRRW